MRVYVYVWWICYACPYQYKAARSSAHPNGSTHLLERGDPLLLGQVPPHAHDPLRLSAGVEHLWVSQ